MRIDLNADVGEGSGYGLEPRSLDPIDESLLALITSANIACGGHAGDDVSMAALCARAAELDVSIGAQVSYVDREGFGRRRLDVDPDVLQGQLTTQIRDLARHAASVGTRVRYVKPHGALYNVTADASDPRNEAHSRAVVAAALEAGHGGIPFAILGMPGSALLRLAAEAGLRIAHEAFADRGYADDGQLVPRTHPAALILAVDDVAARAEDIVRRGEILSVSGTRLRLDSISSICLHSDTPGAVQSAEAVRARLGDAEFRPFA